MSQFTHKNHYVPQFYLKQWSSDNTKIWEYKLLVSNSNVPKWNNVSIEDATGWHRDLYTGIHNNQETDEIEHWFEHEIEHPAQYIFEKIANKGLLNTQDLNKLIRFVAAQYVRTPAAYFRAQQKFKTITSEKIKYDVSQLTSQAASYIQRTPHLDRLGKQAKWFPFKLSLDKTNDEDDMIRMQILTGFTRNMWHFINTTLLEHTYICLLEHDWHVIEAPKNVTLYTSDDPVVFANIYGEGKYDLQGGWGRNLGNAFFPISPNTFLFTQIGTEFSKKNINDALFSLVYWEQRLIIENAFRSLYSISENPLIELCRQRTVSQEAFTKEKILWNEWNNKQNEYEQEFK